MEILKAFRYGAKKLAAAHGEYSEFHRSHGIQQQHWELLTTDEYWTPDQARAIRSILANVVEVSMTIAGMPSIPLPGQYVAAVIAEVVNPVNRMLACVKAPDTFDAMDASGLTGPTEVKEMKVQQMMALVLAYSGEYEREPVEGRIDKEVAESMKQTNKSKTKKALS